MDLEPYRAFLTELAQRSGDFIRPFFGDAGTTVESKSDQSPVTAADRGAEELLRRLIQKKFPGHGIIGEEFGNEKPEAEFVWVLDPIDGTKAFITACPLFGTLIALLHQGQPVLGAIHQPVLRQLLIGDGRSAQLNGRPVRLRRCPDLASAVLLTSDPFNPGKYRNGAAFDALARKVRFARTWGDCYGYLLVASGWADIMTDPIVNPWDIQAIIPIIRGAGGRVTDWSGADPVSGDSLVAAHPDLHPQIIAALNAAPTRP
jgi:myo-inositol-1(or 4)-monophosphatase